MSADYEPALWRPVTKANWSRPKWRTDTDLVIVHVSGGSAQSAYCR